jgi:hypothetical protein
MPIIPQSLQARRPQPVSTLGNKITYKTREMTPEELNKYISEQTEIAKQENENIINKDISIWQQRLNDLELRRQKLAEGGLSREKKPEWNALDDRMGEARVVIAKLEQAKAKGLPASMAADIASQAGTRQLTVAALQGTPTGYESASDMKLRKEGYVYNPQTTQIERQTQADYSNTQGKTAGEIIDDMRKQNIPINSTNLKKYVRGLNNSIVLTDSGYSKEAGGYYDALSGAFYPTRDKGFIPKAVRDRTLIVNIDSSKIASNSIAGSKDLNILNTNKFNDTGTVSRISRMAVGVSADTSGGSIFSRLSSIFNKKKEQAKGEGFIRAEGSGGAFYPLNQDYSSGTIQGLRFNVGPDNTLISSTIEKAKKVYYNMADVVDFKKDNAIFGQPIWAGRDGTAVIPTKVITLPSGERAIVPKYRAISGYDTEGKPVRLGEALPYGYSKKYWDKYGKTSPLSNAGFIAGQEIEPITEFKQVIKDKIKPNQIVWNLDTNMATTEKKGGFIRDFSAGAVDILIPTTARGAVGLAASASGVSLISKYIPRIANTVLLAGGAYSTKNYITAKTDRERELAAAGMVLGFASIIIPRVYRTGKFAVKAKSIYNFNIAEYGSKSEALYSTTRTGLNWMFASKPKDVGIIDYVLPSGKRKTIKIRRGATSEVSPDDLLVNIRDFEDPNKFSAAGQKSFETPVTVKYQRGGYRFDGYKIEEVIVKDVIKQSIKLGTNKFSTTQIGDKLYLTTGSGNRIINNQYNTYEPSKYSLGRRAITEKQSQAFSGLGTSTVEKTNMKIVSNILNNKNIQKSAPIIIKDRDNKILEVGLKTKSGKEGTATFFENKQDVFFGKSDFGFKGLLKERTRQPYDKTPGRIDIQSLVKGKSSKATGGGYSYMEDIAIKDAKKIIDGKRENIMRILTTGRTRAVSQSGNKQIVTRFKTVDVYDKKFPSSGGGSKGNSKNIGGDDEGFGGGGNNMFQVKQNQMPVLYENQFVSSSFAPQAIRFQSTVNTGNIFNNAMSFGSRSILSTISISNSLNQRQSKESVSSSSYKSPVQTLGLSSALTSAMVLTQTPVVTQSQYRTQTLTQALTPVQTTLQKTIQIQTPTTITTPVSIPIPPNNPIPPRPPIITPPPLFWFANEKPKVNVKPYNAYVYVDATKGSKAGYKQINKQPLTLASALSAMARVVDTTISARGKVLPAQPKMVNKQAVKVMAVDTRDTYFQRNSYKFRNYKTNKKLALPTGTLIEKQKFRLDNPSESKRINQDKRSTFGFRL